MQNEKVFLYTSHGREKNREMGKDRAPSLWNEKPRLPLDDHTNHPYMALAPGYLD